MLAILVPVRGRPWNIKKMIMEYKQSTAGCSELLFGLDKTDKYKEDILKEIEGFRYIEGEYAGVSQKLNDMYLKFKDDKYVAYHSSADDITYSKDFDKHILEEIEYLAFKSGHRCWVLYGNDMVHGQELCTHWVTTKELVEARGEFTPVNYMYHQYSDTVNWIVGIKLGVLRYIPWVITHHHSWANGEAQKDENFEIAYNPERANHDKDAFDRWCKQEFPNQAQRIINSIMEQLNAKSKK